jgi:hypothetical protein
MKNLMLLAAGIVASVSLVFGLAACNGGASTLPTLTFQQQVGLVCNYADTAVTIMTDDGLFTGGAQDTLTKKVQPAIDKVCASGATVTTLNLQSLVDTGLPLLKSLVDASTLQQQVKSEANTAIDLTVAAVKTAILLQPVATAAPATGASAASPASSPAAASTPLSGAPLQ